MYVFLLSHGDCTLTCVTAMVDLTCQVPKFSSQLPLTTSYANISELEISPLPCACPSRLLFVSFKNANSTLKQRQTIIETSTRFGEMQCRGDALIGKRCESADDKQPANTVTTSLPVRTRAAEHIPAAVTAEREVSVEDLPCRRRLWLKANKAVGDGVGIL
jgi:hypothetical protein